jgi:hypothetical protein
MIIDSGAFTSWSIGKPVQIGDLIAYNEGLLRDYSQWADFLFISLDVIPGERGRRATSEEIAKAVDQSYDNFVTLQQHFRGHYVLPVYHSGENPKLRDAYLARTDYICLSMDQGMSENNRLEWAKRAAVPGYKYHGLAATGNKMVTRVDWFSVDSSSWLTVGAMGNILWPTDRDGFRVLAVSSTSPLRHEAGKHLQTLVPIERNAVCQSIIRQGFDPVKMATEHNERIRWNVHKWFTTPWRRKLEIAQDLFPQC